MKKVLFAMLVPVILIFVVTSCSSTEKPKVYPIVQMTADVEFSDVDNELLGTLTYTSPNNLSFSYTKPVSIAGFTVSIKGGICETSFKGLTRTCEGTPFSEDSPIITLINVLKTIEEGTAVFETITETSECIYTVAYGEENYNVLSDSKTGQIKKIYSDNFCVAFK